MRMRAVAVGLLLCATSARADRLTADGFLAGLQIAQCNGIAISADGKSIAAVNNAEVVIWDAATQQVRGRAAFTSAYGAQALAFSPDGATVAVGLASTITLYATADAAVTGTIKLGGDGGVQALTYSPDGKWLAASSGGEGGDYRVFGDNLYEVATGRRIKQLAKARSSERLTSSFAFSHDGKYLALAISNKQKGLELWETATWTRKARAPYTADAISVAFFPDDSRLVTGSIDRKIRVHMVVEKAVALAKQFVAHTGTAQDDQGYVTGLAFLPDGRGLVSASDDAEGVRLWDTRSWTQQASLKHSVGRLTSLAMTPDGKQLYVGGTSSKKLQRIAIATP